MKRRKGRLCVKSHMLDYEYCMKPDAFVDFLDNEEHERLQRYVQSHVNKRNDLVRANRKFEKDLRDAARAEVKRCLDGKTVIEDEYEPMELQILMQFAAGDDRTLRLLDVGISELADVLDVPVPEEIREERRKQEEEVRSFRLGDDNGRKLDAIMKKLGIELED